MRKSLIGQNLLQLIRLTGGSPKSDYGQAIEAEVINFTNLFSSKDNLLRPDLNPSLAVYPTFEGDLALGQSGYQKNQYSTQV